MAGTGRLGTRAWAMARPFLEAFGSQGAAADVSALCGWADQPWWNRKTFSQWPSDLRRGTMINCTILLLLVSGTRLRWKQSLLVEPTGSSAATMRYW